MLLTRPDTRKADQHELLAKLTASCPEVACWGATVDATIDARTPLQLGEGQGGREGPG
ncbi:hypothetical protein K2224_16890 [Streptomyces sp. BHT-5-2]|uniref:hypothetical protein n=1 Tax=Streptomyces sp. BHT-5-2 TaxID=2866715 RepID=UPI001C8D95C5|nr:hypothetical protein [Streptomyces sp. BHT-5-2]QZL04620.1 hypothetical protein K2224_16890 [Streptomyces sp. BHT-5-2]